MKRDPSRDYVNDYVVKVERGHPGRLAYNIIATETAWRKLIADLEAALDNPRQLGGKPLKNENGEIYLLEEYATESRGQRERVYIVAYLAEDLAVHHDDRAGVVWNWLGCIALGLALIALMILAAIGASSLLSGFRF